MTLIGFAVVVFCIFIYFLYRGCTAKPRLGIICSDCTEYRIQQMLQPVMRYLSTTAEVIYLNTLQEFAKKKLQSLVYITFFTNKTSWTDITDTEGDKIGPQLNEIRKSVQNFNLIILFTRYGETNSEFKQHQIDDPPENYDWITRYTCVTFNGDGLLDTTTTKANLERLNRWIIH